MVCRGVLRLASSALVDALWWYCGAAEDVVTAWCDGDCLSDWRSNVCVRAYVLLRALVYRVTVASIGLRSVFPGASVQLMVVGILGRMAWWTTLLCLSLCRSSASTCRAMVGTRWCSVPKCAGLCCRRQRTSGP